MARYIVGDIQGCFVELQALLNKVAFNAKQDHLYLAGDLVARGADSLAVLRFIKELGNHAHTVLGNHDLHLLAVAAGFKKYKEKDKTLPILQAKDKEALLTWLRHQPLLIHHSSSNDKGFVLTHAGISPAWDLSTAKSCAREVEAILQGDEHLWLLKNMYADQPNAWSASLCGLARYRYIINALTRMRFCEKNGNLDMQCKLPPEQVDNLLPWFKIFNCNLIEETLIFGHWAALNGHFDHHVIGLDTGCVWGGTLSMLRWEDKKLFTQVSLLN